MRGVLDRRFLERRLRAEATRCPPHPPERIVWQAGDALTPDRQVCLRCGTPLASRAHVPRHR